MENPATDSLGQWLQKRLQSEKLSLRQASAKSGLSHTTIQAIMFGGHASSETIKKLAKAFSGDHHENLALEDSLLIRAGYRTPRDEDISEPVARLMDKISHFSEPQLRLMEHFADFMSEMEKK